MQRQEASILLAAIAGKRALVIGDVLLDAFVYGEVTRISREAPVPILSETRRSLMLGGAGNLVRNIESLGGTPSIITLAGNDEAGQTVAGLLEDCAPGRVNLIRQDGRITPAKTRYVSGSQQMFCVDRNPDQPASEASEAAIAAAARKAVTGHDVVILSDYGRGMLTRAVCKAVIEAANAAGKPVCVDPRGADYTRYDGAFLIKPNAQELSDETGMPVRSDEDAETALRALHARLTATASLIVTRGGKGMSLISSGEVIHHRSRPRSVYDVSGAGDTALAALSLGVAAGLALADTMALADLAAGTAVGKAGTATVSPEEILEEAVQGADDADWRVISRDKAREVIQSWHREGLRVGFTNGCFDILHPGHLSALRHARSVCDRLVVGLNADASVSRLKGPERPVNPAAHRAAMLAALESVDRVVVFAEDTPEELIRAIAPDVLVKGADYKADDLPGAAFVKARGGEVVIAPLQPGFSTTALVEKMKQAKA
ncbi:MAG: D-glycero-beta-D-manno-heptose 1-phosphate adenylyltransferase [Oceanicaulis sp.]|uniref:D-glycero-beta-D-manno-heptose 1-phosphate adenylyltransferase n=1 Tax=Glycocaulis sp. TaxID=1969725 RepID=UPI0025BD209C|nr:D-glycero-beta-D-manno-heptose 1-phosphate adenylyltransferase [Glycocaulis sp.]MCC5980878.1 D-glycero-beta-D-manno-heptose 1-phosphate adenylyltransferase [Oceanicaulis sp.]MCH8521055.1 D-glycero-beta-D-manno-heptose 1-phosphate adenylyltransferase [Glycocaulis sp.]